MKNNRITNLPDRLAKRILLLLAGFSFVCSGYSQVTSFEGTFYYNIRVSGKYASVFMEDLPPTKMDMTIKAPDFKIYESGGQKNKIFLFIADSSETYIIDPSKRVAFLRDYFVDTSGFVPLAKETGKTALVYGETCKEYLVKYPDRNVFYYCVDKYRVDVSGIIGKKDAKANFLTNGLDGRIPLKSKTVTPELTIEVEVAKIELKKFDVAQFRIPEGYKVKKRDPR